MRSLSYIIRNMYIFFGQLKFHIDLDIFHGIKTLKHTIKEYESSLLTKQA